MPVYINEIHANVYNDKSRKTNPLSRSNNMNGATYTMRLHVWKIFDNTYLKLPHLPDTKAI